MTIYLGVALRGRVGQKEELQGGARMSETRDEVWWYGGMVVWWYGIERLDR